MTRITTWLDSHARIALAAIVILTSLLVIPFLAMAPTESASTEPDGAVFTARDTIEDRFASSVYPMFFLVEDPEGDLLRAEPLRRLLEAEQALRDHPEVGDTLFSYFDVATLTEIDGILSIADLIDAEIPGGLATATDEQVKQVGSALIDELGETNAALGLSAASERGTDGMWTVPAIAPLVLGDNEVLGFGSTSVNLGGDTEPEQYARDVQEILRTADGLDVYGVAIDVNLTSQEQGAVAGPFIGMTVFAVLLIVGLTFRSYWVLVTVGAFLMALIVWLKGISNLIGLDDSLVLSLIVPVAMISFGVDFAFHAIGRYREERAEGTAPRRAFTVGLAAVSGALLLALASDVAAFMSNTIAGIESIVQFGLGAGIALAAAFLLLGVAAPLVVSRIESVVPEPRPGRRSTVFRVAASAGAAGMAMASVLLMVFVAPAIGVALAVATVLVTVIVPLWVMGRRGGDAGSVAIKPDRLAGPVGRTVATIARRPGVVLPLALTVTAVAAVFAVRVPAEFDVEDFFSADTDFVIALDLLDEHVGDRGGEPALLYVEGPLDDPAALATLAGRIDEIRTLDTDALAREDGMVRVSGGVFEIFDAVWASPAAQGLIFSETGIEVTDGDADGIPDTGDQIRAIVDVTSEYGVPFDTQRLALTPDDVATSVDLDGDTPATVFELGLVNSRAQEQVLAARSVLDPVAESMSEDFDGSFVQVTGSPFVREASLDATNQALQLSLPVAVLLCLLVAATFLRSLRYGLAAVVPILMVVAWLYGFMELAGYAINLVTATIAAVSIGVGIDFAIHFIARYREELDRHGERLGAVQAAGEGTGSALVASAVSSAIGFGILAFAPMPLFAAYGLLTALMIAMALIATLVVLPSVLVLITRDRVETESEHREVVAV